MSWTTRVDQTRLIDPSRRLITISRLVHPLFDQTIRRFKNIDLNNLKKCTDVFGSHPGLALPTLGHVLEIWLPLDNYNICHIYSFLANTCTDLRVQNNFNQNCVTFASGKKGLWITALEPQKKIQNRFTKTVIN